MRGWRHRLTYDVENRLVQASIARNVTLRYDPLGRLWEVNGAREYRQFLYDGDALVAEYDQWGNMLKRYIHGQGADTPQVWFEGSGVTAADRRYLFTNHQGSVTALADGNGKTIVIDLRALGDPFDVAMCHAASLKAWSIGTADLRERLPPRDGSQGWPSPGATQASANAQGYSSSARSS
jgi:hypothetical protein